MTGLPNAIRACLFDLDGVLTSTADLHMQAWKETFDEILQQRSGGDFSPFTEHDYATYVDGKPRLDGVRAFLSARSIDVPEGSPDDTAGTWSVYGIGTAKNERALQAIAAGDVLPFPGSLRYLEAAAGANLPIGVVTSSANAAAVLDSAGLSRFVQERVDGITIRDEGLRGKPAPDSFLLCAQRLGVNPTEAAVFEDAQAGVQAGKTGGFGYIIGVDRADQATALRTHGADVVVEDLAGLLEEGLDRR